MEFDQFITGSKWTILQELGKKSQSASDIATTLKTSVANINQQLKLLEAYGIIQKEKKGESNKPGKPKTNYTIKKELTYIIKLGKDAVKKISIKPHWGYDIFLNSIDVGREEDSYFITKFCFFTEDILKYCHAIAFLKTNKEVLELILVTDQLDKIRKEYSNTILKLPDGEKKKVVCWSHSEEELLKGIENKEKYFLDLTKDFVIIFDKANALQRVRVQRDKT